MRRPRTSIGVLAAVIALSGCGSSSDPASKTTGQIGPASNVKEFPAAGSKTLGQLVKPLKGGPNLALSEEIIQAGPSQRVGFGLFGNDGKQVRGVPAAFYVASFDQKHLRGPFPVTEQSLAVRPQFQSRTSASDPAAAKSVYVGQAPIPNGSKAILVAIVKQGGRLRATSAIGVRIGVGGGPPDVGSKAIPIHTQTLADVGNDASKIDTRVPPSDMHKVDFAAALGHRPIVLTFATPALCMSRVCGPVVDEILQLESQYGDKADFIHEEIYVGNDVNKGFRPQVKAWRLPTEPWVFAIDRHGVVQGRIEGAGSIDEYRAVIEKALKS